MAARCLRQGASATALWVDMDELVPNPDGCTRFDPNTFKKEKCKNCGRIWKEHLGAISPSVVEQFQKAKQKAVDEKLRQETEAKEKERAKLLAKKKAAQAVEDEWLFDGSKDDRGLEPDSDDDLGFKMFTQEDMASAAFEMRAQRPSDTGKTLKVVNLIDFGECDVPDETAPECMGTYSNALHSDDRGVSLGSDMDGPSFPSGDGDQTGKSNSSCVQFDLGIASNSNGPEASARDVNQELQSEIEHLQLMLAHAKEETSIQVAIVKDEVAERQQLIEDLIRQRGELEASLRNTRTQLQASEDALQEARDEIAQLRTGSSLQSHPELEALRSEVEQLRRERTSAATDPGQVASTLNNVKSAESTDKAARALRELRINAEQQLAWIRKQVKTRTESDASMLGTTQAGPAAVAA